MTKDFKKDLYEMCDRVFIEKIPTAFARYADGEVGIMQGKVFGGIDGWSCKGKTKLGEDLLNTLNHSEEEYFYGISCSDCDNNSKLYLLSLINQNINNITFSNLFVNSNYNTFLDKLKLINEEVILIANEDGKKSIYPFKIKKYMCIPKDVISIWENYSDRVIDALNKLKDNNTLYLISAGPLSEIIIDYLWNKNKSNRYIDIGSSLDEFIHRRKTRPYMMENNFYSNRVCQF